MSAGLVRSADTAGAHACFVTRTASQLNQAKNTGSSSKELLTRPHIEDSTKNVLPSRVPAGTLTVFRPARRLAKWRTFLVDTDAWRRPPVQTAPRTANQSGSTGKSFSIWLAPRDPARATLTPASRQRRRRRRSGAEAANRGANAPALSRMCPKGGRFRVFARQKTGLPPPAAPGIDPHPRKQR